jgi:hypothetical protein
MMNEVPAWSCHLAAMRLVTVLAWPRLADRADVEAAATVCDGAGMLHRQQRHTLTVLSLHRCAVLCVGRRRRLVVATPR